MTKGVIFGKVEIENSSEGKLPKTNWLLHATAFENFSSQHKFLKTGFLFSLPTQRPAPKESFEGMLLRRPIVFEVQRNGRLGISQIDKAWKTLCTNPESCKSYLRPGVTSVTHNPVPNKPKPVQHTYQRSDSSNHVTGASSHVLCNLQNGGCESLNCNFSLRHDTTNAELHASSETGIPDVIGAPLKDGLSRSSLSNNHSLQEDVDETFVDALDDDYVFEGIDVDQIVLEHCQGNGTPEGSVSKHSPFTPVDKAGIHSGNMLPVDLLNKCIHGYELARCPEAGNHLQEMKDELINISNELLDNAAELSHSQSENLRHERLLLNKQIQQLERHLHSSSQDENRRSSLSMVSPSAAKSLQPETPSSRLVVDDKRFNSQFQIGNDPGKLQDPTSSVTFSSSARFSSMPFSSTDRFSMPFSSADRLSSMPFYSTDRITSTVTPIERETCVPKVIEVNYVEGSDDRRWKSLDFPWTKTLEASNRRIFGNHSFRPNQREVINATMSGHDVFVLMPTGGGKSLTYQLPALISPGITLVVSPLVSLIQDQIMHLLQANIPATYLSANLEWSEQQEILRELMSDVCKYRLLYVTPEKVAKSDVLLRHLESMYARQSLARIVIDEAHCVSQWGHDFRPDYQGLGILKQKFRDTPVLALTATATASVREDVVQALGLVNCIIFRQSFNRPNLWFSIMPKTKKCLDDIDKFIKEKHFDECGIIYCLSRMDCEKVAERLQECGHKAAFYHGSMDPVQRAFVQKQWSKDEINIMCATVAFGMGINKPDVRFVIHHSLPKSIEGYHQECGRAGRDGLRSTCVLFYNYSDYIRVKHMLTQGVIEQSPCPSGSRRSSLSNADRVLETNIENLLRMVSYCENDVDCRRFLQLIHFGEKFDPANCKKTCDNCLKMSISVEKNVTDVAKQLIELVKSTGQHSMSHVLDVYRGSMSQIVKKYRHDSVRLHGAGKHLAKGEASRIMRHLVVEDILVEDVKKSDFYGSVSSVLKVNESKARKLYSGELAVVMRFPAPANAFKMGKDELTPAKGALQIGDVQIEALNKEDSKLSAHIYSALRMLRTVLLKEAGDGVMAYHIFGNATLLQISKKIPRTKEELIEINGIGKAKVSKYGDRVLDCIESTIKEFEKTSKNTSSSSNDNSDGSKRRRTSRNAESDATDDDLNRCTTQSKKRQSKTTKKPKGVTKNLTTFYQRCIDVDLDGAEVEIERESVAASEKNKEGRVLPQWSRPKQRREGQIPNTDPFQEYAFKK